jgi:ABC-type nitrate/sulfonate/bicarbonate transport system permease component
MGRIRIVAQFVDPLLQFMRPISPVALVPLSIIWFGIGDMSRYFIIFYGVVIIVILNTAAGVVSTPNIRLNAAKCLGARRSQIFRRIIIPSAVPYILTGMRVALGFAFMGIVAAEMIAAQSGIGYLIMQSRMLLRTDIMFVGLVTLGVLGAVIDGCFKLAINRTMQRFMEHQINV